MAATDYIILTSTIKAIFASYNETDYFFENDFHRSKDKKEFIKIFIVLPISDREDITTSDSIDTGAIMIQIFTEVNEGTERSDEIKSILRTLLVNQEFNDCLYTNVVSNPPVTQSNKRYYQQNLEAKFIFSYRN